MGYIKLIIAAVGFLGAAAIGWWLVNMIQENERLTLNNLALNESNMAHMVAMEELEADSKAKDEAIAARTKRILQLNKTILKAQNEVRTITKTVTAPERECLLAPVPDAIIDFMFANGEAGSSPGSGEGLSSGTTVQ